MSFPLYMDENVHPEVSHRLRHDGYDVETASEAGLAGSGVPDVEHLQYAAATGRVLFTHDLRTMPAAAQQRLDTGRDHPGLILCDFRPAAELAARLQLALEHFDSDGMRNTTIWLPGLEA